MTQVDLDAVLKRIQAMPEAEKAKLKKEVLASPAGRKWIPSPGAQAQAFHSPADLLLYGGQAGGGKSALLTGLSLTAHRRSLIMRRQYTDINALIEDTLKQYGSRRGFNGSAPASLKTDDKRLIEFGAAKLPGDEEHWKGQPHDFLGVDEASQFLESQVRFLMGWVRSTDSGQRCRVVLATNPPEKAILGRWLVEMFAPWLDPNHSNPAQPGELRWYVSDDQGKDREVPGPEKTWVGKREVTPLSRTFIPASLKDNPFLSGTTYEAQLDSLPEPLRSSVRDGNWMISHEDDQWQIIPTNWILEAQARWTRNPPMNAPMCAMGVDVAQGGADQTVIAPRYDYWFADLIVTPGRETPLGTDVAALVIKHRRNNSAVVIDMGGGYGMSAFEHLQANAIPIKGFNGAKTAEGRTADRQLGFYNKRAEIWWRFREALDPGQANGSPIALPPDNALVADLTAPRYEITPRGIKVELKEDIAKRIGRSTDRGDAVVMAWSHGPSYVTHSKIWKAVTEVFTAPRVNRGYENRRRRR